MYAITNTTLSPFLSTVQVAELFWMGSPSPSIIFPSVANPDNWWGPSIPVSLDGKNPSHPGIPCEIALDDLKQSNWYWFTISHFPGLWHTILVGRPFPPYYDWCRISTGRIEDVERFAEVLRKYYS